MNKILMVILAALFAQSTLAATSFSSLEEQMPGKDFQAAVLEKLSASELER